VTRLTPCGLPESLGSLSANGSHETHFNIQRRLYDYQFSFARTPAWSGPRDPPLTEAHARLNNRTRTAQTHQVTRAVDITALLFSKGIIKLTGKS
jgi:hypothetical protein